MGWSIARFPSAIRRFASRRLDLNSSAISRLDHDLRCLARGASGWPDLLPHLGGKIAVDLRVRAVRIGRHHRTAGIGRFADHEIERHFAEEGHAELLRLAPRTAVAENFRAR